MKFVQMENVRQRWTALSSNRFRLSAFIKNPIGRTEQIVVELIAVRGLLYPVGREPDRDECQAY